MLANLVKNPISVVKKVFFIFSKFSLFLWCRPFLFKQVCHVTPLKLAKLQKHNNAYRGFNLLLQVIQSATDSCNLLQNHAIWCIIMHSCKNMIKEEGRTDIMRKEMFQMAGICLSLSLCDEIVRNATMNLINKDK